MRRSFDGLSALVKHRLLDDPLSGHLYVFVNRRGSQMKILTFDRTGYAIWAKRLERGRISSRPGSAASSVRSRIPNYSACSTASKYAMHANTSAFLCLNERLLDIM